MCACSANGDHVRLRGKWRPCAPAGQMRIMCACGAHGDHARLRGTWESSCAHVGQLGITRVGLRVNVDDVLAGQLPG